MSPVDDLTIGDNTLLWRRLAPSHYVIDSNGQRIISPAAFKDKELSAYIASPQTTRGAFLAGYPQHGLVAFAAGDARQEGYILVRDPPGDPCHVHVVSRVELTKNPRERQVRRLRDRAVLLIEPQILP